MPVFSTVVDQIVEQGGAANAFTSVLGIKFANTLGHRARLRKIVASGGGAAPRDEQVTLRARRTDNTADGTSTPVNVNTIGKQDAGSVASLVAAIGKSYTVEPTTKETGIIGLGGFNTRGVLQKDWSCDPAKAPVWGINQTLLIECAPGQAVGAELSIAVEWEEF